MKKLDFAPSFSPRIRLVTVQQCWAVAEAPRVLGPYDARDLVLPYFDGKDREHLVVLHLDTAHAPVSAEVVSIGTLNAALVHPREVFKGALLANAQAIIVAHNHPSGSLEPSAQDERTFSKLVEAGNLLDIKVLDFLVVANRRYRSLVDSSTG